MLHERIFVKTPDLTADEAFAHDVVVNKRLNTLVTGGGGSGKTHLVSTVLESCSLRVVACGATSSAAMLLQDKATFHSVFFGRLVDVGPSTELATEARDITTDSHVRTRLQNCDLVVVDEVSMLSATLLDLADYVARFARNVKDQWFGGLQMVFVGDFFQLEPVDAEHNGWAFEAKSWAAVRAVINMRHNYRAAADPIFCQHLDLIRRGEGPLASDIRYLLVNRQLKCPTVVFATNREADAMNARKVEELSGPKLVYKALNAPVADLTLCKNAHVMTTRSLTLDGERVPNGARGTVFSFQPFKSSPEMAFWEVQPVKQVPIVTFPNYGTFPIYPARILSNGCRDAVQLPLKLAFAATAHRLQGQGVAELDACAVRVFAHGHLYSMLSRVMSSRGLVLSGLDSVAALDDVLARNRETTDPKVRQFYADIGC